MWRLVWQGRPATEGLCATTFTSPFLPAGGRGSCDQWKANSRVRILWARTVPVDGGGVTRECKVGWRWFDQGNCDLIS